MVELRMNTNRIERFNTSAPVGAWKTATGRSWTGGAGERGFSRLLYPRSSAQSAVVWGASRPAGPFGSVYFRAAMVIAAGFSPGAVARSVIVPAGAVARTKATQRPS